MRSNIHYTDKKERLFDDPFDGTVYVLQLSSSCSSFSSTLRCKKCVNRWILVGSQGCHFFPKLILLGCAVLLEDDATLWKFNLAFAKPFYADWWFRDGVDGILQTKCNFLIFTILQLLATIEFSLNSFYSLYLFFFKPRIHSNTFDILQQRS